MLTNHLPTDKLTVTLRISPEHLSAVDNAPNQSPYALLVKLRELGSLLEKVCIRTVEVEDGLL